MQNSGKAGRKRIPASQLQGEYCCIYAEESGRAIPGVGGTLKFKARSRNSGSYELTFLCRGSEETEKGTFVIKDNLIDFRLRESNYTVGPVEGAKAKFMLDDDALTFIYIEPETSLILLLQKWKKVQVRTETQP